MNSENQNFIIGQNIRTLGQKMALTQDGLAQYLGTSRELVGYYEIGKRQHPIYTVKQAGQSFLYERV